jgi:hypothetical protein
MLELFTVNRLETMSYYLQVQNDGNALEKIILSGTAGDSNWTISYYDVSDGEEPGILITDDIITGNYQPELSGFETATRTIKIAVTPSTLMRAKPPFWAICAAPWSSTWQFATTSAPRSDP